MKTFVFGQAASGQPVIAHQFLGQGPKVLLIGGVHGDEHEGVTLARGLLQEFIKNYQLKLDLIVIPEFNPDGVLLKTRTNLNGVDLNRNLPTKDWSPEHSTPRYFPGMAAASEPENQNLIGWLKSWQPKLIMSFHSWHPVINVNGDCEAEAEIMHKITSYKVDKDIGYPTPGCLGTFTGLERNMPTITLEIERGLALPEILKLHIPSVIKALEHTQQSRKG